MEGRKQSRPGRSNLAWVPTWAQGIYQQCMSWRSACSNVVVNAHAVYPSMCLHDFKHGSDTCRDACPHKMGTGAPLGMAWPK